MGLCLHYAIQWGDNVSLLHPIGWIGPEPPWVQLVMIRAVSRRPHDRPGRAPAWINRRPASIIQGVARVLARDILINKPFKYSFETPFHAGGWVVLSMPTVRPAFATPYRCTNRRFRFGLTTQYRWSYQYITGAVQTFSDIVSENPSSTQSSNWVADSGSFTSW